MYMQDSEATHFSRLGAMLRPCQPHCVTSAKSPALKQSLTVCIFRVGISHKVTDKIKQQARDTVMQSGAYMLACAQKCLCIKMCCPEGHATVWSASR